MTIEISTVTNNIKTHLSIIGKRLLGKDGKPMFSDIMPSSAENGILTQFIFASAQDIEGVLKQFITASTSGPTSISFTISNTRGDDDFDNRAKELITSYLTLNSVGEYLSMMHPDIAQKYQRDAQQRMEMLVAYVFYKNPPNI